MNCRIIPYKIASAAFNMAADYYLLNNSQLPTIRFYGWLKPSLSFGKSQNNLTDINFEFCQQHEFEFIRRQSGGKTVFHHQDLTYAITSPISLISPSILESYRLISEKLISGLNITQLSMQPTKKLIPQTSNCFLELSSWEVNFQGKKLIGSAQTRLKESMLQHGSILLELDKFYWQNIWYSGDLFNRICSLSEIIGAVPNIAIICENLTTAFLELFNYPPKIEPFNNKELIEIDKLMVKFMVNRTEFNPTSC